MFLLGIMIVPEEGGTAIDTSFYTPNLNLHLLYKIKKKKKKLKSYKKTRKLDKNRKIRKKRKISRNMVKWIKFGLN